MLALQEQTQAERAVWEHPEGLIRKPFTTPVCSILVVGLLTVGDRFWGGLVVLSHK